jgi:sugar O-acyltransferase (sialic acid O-acetyltransferase NeuD family)
MTAARVVLLGTGMFAEELTDLVAEVEGYELAAYCENLDRSRAGGTLLDHSVMWVDDLPSLGDVRAVSAITTTRRELYVEQVRALGIPFASLVHPRATIARSTTVGEGVVVQAGAFVGARATVADQVTINRGALVGHHVTLGRFATVQPGAIVGGACEVGERAYIAMGALVLERLRIGEGALIAAGSVVTRDVEPHTMVMGSPARVVKRDVTGLEA